MKLKGVNPIAQHIEKIVLGITVLLFLAVISSQFVSQPNMIKAGSREVSPDQIFNELATTAFALQSQITDTSPVLPDVEPVVLLDRYTEAFESVSIAGSKLPIALGTGTDVPSLLQLQDFEPTTQDAIVAIEAMHVPPTSQPLVASSWATLDPYAALEVPEFESFIPKTQPFDFPSVSIESEFSGTTLNNVLEGNDGYPGIPRLFWVSTGMAVMGLEAQRQELQQDGSWSDPQSITKPPQTPLPTNAVNDQDGLVVLNKAINNAKSVAEQVMRPIFPPTISGPQWLPPSDTLDSKDTGLTDTQRLQRQLARLTTELKQLSSAPRTRTTSPGSRGGSGKTSSRDPGSTSRNTQRSSDQSKQRIDRIKSQINDIKEDLDRLGVDSDNDLVASLNDILTQDSIQLWTHDLGIEPGATYRYRTRAVLNNPYFRKGPYLDETDDSQQQLAVEPFVSGDWSEWSEPVAVGAQNVYFVTESTVPLSGPDPSQARVELYSMYYGYYRRSSISIEPGQALTASLRVSGDLVLFDTQAIQSKDAASYIDSLNDSNADQSTPIGITDAPDKLAIDLGAHLIEIASNPLANQSTDSSDTVLIFRLLDGSLVLRNPAGDKSSQIYAQAQSSATQATRSQLRPVGMPALSQAAKLFKPAEP